MESFDLDYSMTQFPIDWRAHLLVKYSKNTFACQLLDGQVQDDKYEVVGEIIYHKDKIYLVPETKMKEMILEEGTSTNIIEPMLDDQLDGNLGSTSDSPNKQSLSVAVQPSGDADLIEDYLQEQSLQLVDYEVYSPVAIMMNYIEEFQVWDPGDLGHDNIHIRVAQQKVDGNVVLRRIVSFPLFDYGLLKGKQSLGSEDLSCPLILM